MEIQDLAVYAVLLLVAFVVGVRVYRMFTGRRKDLSGCHGCSLAGSCGTKSRKNALKTCGEEKKHNENFVH